MEINATSPIQQSAALSAAVVSGRPEAKEAKTEAAGASSSGLNAPAYAVNLATQDAKAEKGLSADAVAKMRDDVTKSQQLMIRQLTEMNAKLQGYQAQGIGKLNFDGLSIDTSKFALPAVATTPEEAEEALGEGGDWSVDAVAGRVMDMATAIAGGDETKLEAMRSAVQKGFEQAGAAFNKVYGTSEMPQITQDTQAEIMKRFDSVKASYQQAASGTDAAANEPLASAAKEVM